MTKKRNELKKKSGDVDKKSDLLDDIVEFDDYYDLTESMSEDV